MTVVLWRRPIARIQTTRAIVIRVVFVLHFEFASFVVTNLHFHVEFLQRIEVGGPALLQETIPRFLRIHFLRFIQSGQIFHFEFSHIQLFFVGERSEQCAICEFISFPVGTGRPNARIAKHQRQSLADDLIFSQWLVGDTFARVDLVGVGDLQKCAQEIGQTQCHFRFIFEKVPGPVANVSVQNQILRMEIPTRRRIDAGDEFDSRIDIDFRRVQ